MDRLSWDDYFMIQAKVASLRSGCNSRPVGAVLVKDNRLLATGYNGPVSGTWHCTDYGPEYCYRRAIGIADSLKQGFCRASHAEANAIAAAARAGVSVKDSTLYCTLSPCHTCIKLLSVAGIRKILYEIEYKSKDISRDEEWKRIWNEAIPEGVHHYEISGFAFGAIQTLFTVESSKRRLESV